jgi:NAD-dependent dihydropyrimidine dehydrogenase PreA subunit
MSDKIYMIPNPPTPNQVVKFNTEKCTGCNRCVEVCPNDVLMPNPQKKQPPMVLYQDECWYCGGCVEECPRKGAVTLLHPLQQRISVNWKNKESGEYRGLVMKNPPPPNTRPPVGGWNLQPPQGSSE